jgi:hypothetical protein
VTLSDDGYGVSAAIFNDETYETGVVYWAGATGMRARDPGDPAPTWIRFAEEESNAVVALSGDGDTLVLGSGSLSLWSSARILSGESSASWSIPLRVLALEVREEGELILTSVAGDMAWSLQIYDNHGMIIGYEEIFSPGMTLSASDDGKIIVIGDNEENIYLFSLN